MWEPRSLRGKCVRCVGCRAAAERAEGAVALQAEEVDSAAKSAAAGRAGCMLDKTRELSSNNLEEEATGSPTPKRRVAELCGRQYTRLWKRTSM